MGDTDQKNCALLSLPYDIRFLIYQHLFPLGDQLYLQAWPKHYHCIIPEYTVPTPLLRTCRLLNSEGSEYLYNHYLFNIVGRKADCLTTHDHFVKTLTKYGRERIYVYALGNGPHSSTMCISLHTGPGKVEIVMRRQRGVAQRIEDVRAEIEADSAWVRRLLRTNNLWYLLSMALAALVGVLAWMTAVRRVVQ